jgi:hypothetical protein
MDDLPVDILARRSWVIIISIVEAEANRPLSMGEGAISLPVLRLNACIERFLKYSTTMSFMNQIGILQNSAVFQ